MSSLRSTSCNHLRSLVCTPLCAWLLCWCRTGLPCARTHLCSHSCRTWSLLCFMSPRGPCAVLHKGLGVSDTTINPNKRCIDGECGFHTLILLPTDVFHVVWDHIWPVIFHAICGKETPSSKASFTQAFHNKGPLVLKQPLIQTRIPAFYPRFNHIHPGQKQPFTRYHHCAPKAIAFPCKQFLQIDS